VSIDIVLWNSISKRRRSPGDTFLENGLGILKAHLEERGFSVEVVDWARSACWKELTPVLLSRINRYLGEKLMAGKRKKAATALYFPLFLLSQELTSAIQKRRLERRLREFSVYLRDSGCRVLGIKTWYGESYAAAKTLAAFVRETAPGILIVAGGPHSSVYRETLLEDGGFDLAVVGEGERVLSGILALAKRMETKRKLLEEIADRAERGELRNLVYRRDGGTRMSRLDEARADEKPVPAYSSVEGKTMIHVVVDSLGCPWGACNFCVHSRIYPCLSLRNPEAVVDEIGLMAARGIGVFRFAGSSSSLGHIEEIARLIEKRGMKIVYSMFARSEPRISGSRSVYERTVESYRTIIRSGLRAVFLGGEAADDGILRKVMNKGLTEEDIIATMKAMREAATEEGLPLDIGLSLIYPAPTMGMVALEELRESNIRLVETTSPDSVLISPPAPFPGTSWYRESARFGFRLADDFAGKMLGYDYVMYKPPSMWPDIDLELEGLKFREILEECNNLRNALEEKGFVTEVTDEHFLMLRMAGYTGKEGAKKFKEQAVLDIVSSNYDWIMELEEKVNRASRAQAMMNVRG